eukprot:COSAG01_NODE_30939_length_606_cov_11.990138_1_plen_97_part_00
MCCGLAGTVMDACFVDLPAGAQEDPSLVDLESDVKDISSDPTTDLGSAAAAPLYAFPLLAQGGPYLCSQGCGGWLTHVFPETYRLRDISTLIESLD